MSGVQLMATDDDDGIEIVCTAVSPSRPANVVMVMTLMLVGIDLHLPIRYNILY